MANASTERPISAPELNSVTEHSKSFGCLCTGLILTCLIVNKTLAQPPADSANIVTADAVNTPAPTETTDALPSAASLIERVTLYRDQALVTRRIDIPAGQEVREISVGRLPNQVDVDSVYAESSQAIEVRGVRVTQRAASAETGEANELTQAFEEVRQEQQQTNRTLESVSRKLSYIDKLMQFNLDASHADRNRGILDASSLLETTNYALEQQSVLQTEQAELQDRLLNLTKKAELIRQRQLLLSSPANSRYEVRVLVANREPNAGGTIELSYLVSGCKWSPQYTIRGELGQDKFALRYSALVEQMSGEDWTNVQLTLSTASPSMGAAGPSLTPFRVAVGGGGATYSAADDLFGNAGMGGYGGDMGGGMGGGYGGEAGNEANGETIITGTTIQQRSDQLREQQIEVNNRFAGKYSNLDNLNRDYALNSLASEVQNMELSADAKQLKTLASDADADVASQVYQLDQPVSLDSRREQQLVSIIDSDFKGSLYHVATPLLSSFAYREADLLNEQPVGLLRGPATVYLDGRFVGRTEIPSIASGQHLIVGFGADNQVRTRRELLDKTDEVQGGNRRLTFKYRLVVANFKSVPVDLRLYDRLPIASQTAEISVQPIEFQRVLSGDGLYARIQKPRGILRWDLEVPGEQFGEKAFDVEYSYSVEFDSSRSLTAVIDNERIADDYQQLSAPSAGMGGGMGGK